MRLGTALVRGRSTVQSCAAAPLFLGFPSTVRQNEGATRCRQTWTSRGLPYHRLIKEREDERLMVGTTRAVPGHLRSEPPDQDFVEGVIPSHTTSSSMRTASKGEWNDQPKRLSRCS